MTVNVITGDCRSIMRDLPDSSVDVVIADPPYGETNLAWDRWPHGWLAELPRVMRPSATLWCFGSLRMFMKHADEFRGWNFVQDVVWEKHNGSNSHAERFRKVHEVIAQFHPVDRPWAQIYRKPLFSDDATARTIRRKQKPQHWGQIGEHFYESQDGGPRLLRSVWPCRSEHGRAIHPTQKPLGVIAPLIAYSCPPGGMVLDPFGGSGSTGIAAKQAGCSAVLIEGDIDNATASRDRLANDSPLFAEPAAIP